MDKTSDDDDLDVVEYEEFVLPDEFERSMGISLIFCQSVKNGFFFLRFSWRSLGKKIYYKDKKRDLGK